MDYPYCDFDSYDRYPAVTIDYLSYQVATLH